MATGMSSWFSTTQSNTEKYWQVENQQLSDGQTWRKHLQDPENDSLNPAPWMPCSPCPNPDPSQWALGNNTENLQHLPCVLHAPLYQLLHHQHLCAMDQDSYA